MRTLALWGGGGGGNSPQKPKKCKNGGFTFFYSKYYIPDTNIYPVMMWIQIHARGAEFYFL